VRRTGADALGLLAIDARDALPDLASALSDDELDVRLAALDAVGEFGRTARPFAAAVADRLARAPTSEEKAAAASVLANLEAAADHLDLLLEALVTEAPAVQAGAAAALAAVLDGPDDAERGAVSRALRTLRRG
jgi:HEAT repeat protein